MFKALIFVLSVCATNALANDLDRFFEEAARDREQKYERDVQRIESELRASREYDQRDRLSNDQNRVLEGIEYQLSIQNLNSLPRR